MVYGITTQRIELERFLNNDRQVYSGFIRSVPTAGQFAGLQIVNPSGTGCRVYPRKIQITTSTSNTQSSRVTVRRAATPIGSEVLTKANKYEGNVTATACAKLYQATFAATASFPSGTEFASGYTTRGTSYQLVADHPFRISPGQGLFVGCYDAAVDIILYVEWFEIF